MLRLCSLVSDNLQFSNSGLSLPQDGLSSFGHTTSHLLHGPSSPTTEYFLNHWNTHTFYPRSFPNVLGPTIPSATKPFGTLPFFYNTCSAGTKDAISRMKYQVFLALLLLMEPRSLFNCLEL